MIRIKSLRKIKSPFCSFLAKISYYYRLLSTKFYRTSTKIKYIWKINHCSFSDSINRNYKFLSLCDDNQLIFIINFGFGRKSDNKFCFHPSSYFGSTLNFIISLIIIRKQNLKQFWIRLYNFYSSWKSVFIS